MQLSNLRDTETDLETTDHLTKEQLFGVMPDKRFRKHITDEVVAVINSEPDWKNLVAGIEEVRQLLAVF